jgi:hypothetical protein
MEEAVRQFAQQIAERDSEATGIPRPAKIEITESAIDLEPFDFGMSRDPSSEARPGGSPQPPPAVTCDLSAVAGITTLDFHFEYTNNCGCSVAFSLDRTWTRDDSVYPPPDGKFLFRCVDIGGGVYRPQFQAGSITSVGYGYGQGIEIFQGFPNWMEANVDINMDTATGLKLIAYCSPGMGGCTAVTPLDGEPDPYPSYRHILLADLAGTQTWAKTLACGGGSASGSWAIVFS